MPGMENFAPLSHGDQERVGGVAEVAAHLILDAAQSAGDLGGK